MSIIETEAHPGEHTEPMRSRGGIDRRPDLEAQQQFWEDQRNQIAALQPDSGKNVGPDERAVSLAAGAILLPLGLFRRSWTGLLTAGIGAALIHRGYTGQCSVYGAMNVSTAPHPGQTPEQTHAQSTSIAAAITINKSPEELYNFWRNFQNLPRFIEHLESVHILDDRRSHWIARIPSLLGGKAEWDAEITRDQPNELIEWHSINNPSVDSAGQVRFQPALGDRGTEVHIWMNYTPPAGRLGHWVAALLGDNPKRTVNEGLHNFKRLMEIGEILTLNGQPHGTCLGQGKPYRESTWKPLFT